MSKIKKFLHSRTFPLVLTILTVLVIIAVTAPYIYDSFRYQETFYIGYAQYPGASVYYRAYSPKMEHATPNEYDGLEFIGWYYLDQDGNEKEFIPSEFTPPQEYEINSLTVYGRWKTVAPKDDGTT